MPGAPGVTPRLFATRLQPGVCRVVPLRWPASQRSAGACEQVYRAPNPAGNAHGVRCESPNVACAIHITCGRIAGPFCSAPALSRGTVRLSKIILRLELICSDCDETGLYGKPMTHTSRKCLLFPSFSIISCDLLSSHARGKGVVGGSCFLAKVERARTKI